MTAPDDNSGIFVAFPHPEQQNYDNTAYVGVNFGFEVQIDEQARPDGAPIHRRSEEHTSELQSLAYLVCRLLLEKKKKTDATLTIHLHTPIDVAPNKYDRLIAKKVQHW